MNASAVLSRTLTRGNWKGSDPQPRDSPDVRTRACEASVPHQPNRVERVVAAPAERVREADDGAADDSFGHAPLPSISACCCRAASLANAGCVMV